MYKLAKKFSYPWFLLIAIGIAAILCIFPELDLIVSKCFYQHEHQFFLKHNLLVAGLHNSIPYIVKALIVILATAFISVTIFKKKLLNLGKREIAYLVASLIIGPGLIINIAFKDHIFGRARPNQVQEFNGNKTFTGPLVISKQCEKNCSFTSGHAAASFYFTAFAFIAANPISANLIFYASVIFGLIIGLVRVVQGVHFLSDVVFSGLIVVIINYFMYRLFFPSRNINKKFTKT